MYFLYSSISHRRSFASTCLTILVRYLYYIIIVMSYLIINHQSVLRPLSMLARVGRLLPYSGKVAIITPVTSPERHFHFQVLTRLASPVVVVECTWPCGI